MAGAKITYDAAVTQAVRQGLTHYPKYLPSWLFYDELGDQLFRRIMRMPEYYLTRCEYDILQHNKEALRKHFSRNNEAFRLVELGAGDGLKTEILLRNFVDHSIDFTYAPVDISANALDILKSRLLDNNLSQLRFDPINDSYDGALARLHTSREKKVILFLGASIGNFSVEEAAQFLRKLARPLNDNDLILLGIDLKKDPRIILEAYDDPQGLTASFNKNMLTRLNREAGATFDPENFMHFPYDDPQSGAAKSFLVSKREQVVTVDAIGKSISFDPWESIQTEVSQKYDLGMIEKMMAITGLKIIEIFFDSDHYFCDILLRPNR
jgi:L-histidine N-alpha-methyltransferase